MTFSTIVPQPFAATVGNLVQFTGAMHSIARFMPGLNYDGSIPDRVDPLINPDGSDTVHRLADMREIVQRMEGTVSNMRRTMSLVPAPYRGEATKTEPAGIRPGFSNERSHLQEIVDKHVEADAASSCFVKDKAHRCAVNFLCRLGSMTGKTIAEVTGTRDKSEAQNWIDQLERMNGLRLFSVLNGTAERRFAETGPTMSGTSADMGLKMFERGILYRTIDEVDEYASRKTEETFEQAAKFFIKADLLGSALISRGLAAHTWDRREVGEWNGAASENPHAYGTARLATTSLDTDRDPSTFGLRYLHGLHYADRSKDWAAKQWIFGASVTFYRDRGMKREMAQAVIRESHAFSKRTDTGARKEWGTISEHLSLALGSFGGTLMGRDTEAMKHFKELSEVAKKYARGAS